jgi:hypothetical protein
MTVAVTAKSRTMRMPKLNRQDAKSAKPWTYPLAKNIRILKTS